MDGNLLVEDLKFSRESVESILNGTFKPMYLLSRMYPGVVFKRYPQLLDELKKRRHVKPTGRTVPLPEIRLLSSILVGRLLHALTAVNGTWPTRFGAAARLSVISDVPSQAQRAR